jgi:hypothetical protein
MMRQLPTAKVRGPEGDIKDIQARLLEKRWVEQGDHIRSEVDDDIVLNKALWSLLPPYIGPAPLTLYQGETLWNRRRRTYGQAWTTDVKVARNAALGPFRSFEGGSVLLKTIASRQAIISAPAHGEDRYGEQEYLVDRRRLERVEVVERFTQVALGSDAIVLEGNRRNAGA